MTRPRIGAIGIDIGTHTVKLAQAEQTPIGVRLHRAAVIGRPVSWNASDRLAWDQPLTSATEIQAALDGGGFSGRDAVCTVSMNVCQMRGLNIPPGNGYERRSMIRDELAEEWNEQRSEMELDYWELESGAPDKGADRNTVEVLAATRLWVSQLVRDCRQAGLDCWVLDGVPLAMARAVAMVGGLASGRKALAIDWGYSNTTLCVVGDNRPLYTRRIHDCGFGQVLESIGRVLGVTLDEARYLVDVEGVLAREAATGADHEVRRAITEASGPIVESLAHEIGRTLQFIETQRQHLKPTSAWLLGGGASMRNIGDWFSRLVTLPVRPWSIANHARLGPLGTGQRGAIFATATALSGLAWRAP